MFKKLTKKNWICNVSFYFKSYTLTISTSVKEKKVRKHASSKDEKDKKSFFKINHSKNQQQQWLQSTKYQ